MMTATVPKKQTARREQLTTILKQRVAELDLANERVRRVEPELFRCTYEWVSIAVQDGDARDNSVAFTRLAATLGRSLSCVKGWYYCGKYMSENNLGQEADATSVQAVVVQLGSLTKADHLRCLDLIRKGAPSPEVRAIVRKSTFRELRSVERKTERLYRGRELTKSRIRMEMMALRTLASRYFGKSVEVAVYEAGTDTELESV